MPIFWNENSTFFRIGKVSIAKNVANIDFFLKWRHFDIDFFVQEYNECVIVDDLKPLLLNWMFAKIKAISQLNWLPV